MIVNKVRARVGQWAGGERERYAASDTISVIRALLCSLAFWPGLVHPAEQLDREFWEDYQPYHQYDGATISDLRRLGERDLVKLHPRNGGIVLRVVGRNSAFSKLLSARISINDRGRAAITVKVLPSERSSRPGLSVRSSAVSAEHAAEFLDVLERRGFWSAPSDESHPPRADGLEVICFDAAGWLIEGITADQYQQIFRSNCEQLEPAAEEIRDFLLHLVDVSAGGFE